MVLMGVFIAKEGGGMLYICQSRLCTRHSGEYSSSECVSAAEMVHLVPCLYAKPFQRHAKVSNALRLILASWYTDAADSSSSRVQMVGIVWRRHKQPEPMLEPDQHSRLTAAIYSVPVADEACRAERSSTLLYHTPVLLGALYSAEVYVVRNLTRVVGVRARCEEWRQRVLVAAGIELVVRYLTHYALLAVVRCSD